MWGFTAPPQLDSEYWASVWHADSAFHQPSLLCAASWSSLSIWGPKGPFIYISVTQCSVFVLTVLFGIPLPTCLCWILEVWVLDVAYVICCFPEGYTNISMECSLNCFSKQRHKCVQIHSHTHHVPAGAHRAFLRASYCGHETRRVAGLWQD